MTPLREERVDTSRSGAGISRLNGFQLTNREMFGQWVLQHGHRLPDPIRRQLTRRQSVNFPEFDTVHEDNLRKITCVDPGGPLPRGSTPTRPTKPNFVRAVRLTIEAHG
jgi:hypothetical protein